MLGEVSDSAAERASLGSVLCKGTLFTSLVLAANCNEPVNVNTQTPSSTMLLEIIQIHFHYIVVPVLSDKKHDHGQIKTSLAGIWPGISTDHVSSVFSVTLADNSIVPCR